MTRRKTIIIILFIFSIILALISFKGTNRLAADITGITTDYDKIIDLSSSDKICEAIKTNNTLKIGVYNSSSDIYNELVSPSNSCNNGADFDNYSEEIPWTYFGREYYSNKVYVDDILIKDEKEYGKYSPFFIRNSPISGNATKTATLTPNDDILMHLNVEDKNFRSNTYKDLRLTLDYSTYSSLNISEKNSITYYVYTDKYTYGPYGLDDSIFINNIYVESSGKMIKLPIYRLISDNLVKDIPSGEKIKEIIIVPYENYSAHKGELRMYGMQLNGYNTDYNYAAKVALNDAGIQIRKDIVDNMLENATIKWDVSPDPNITLHFYHHYVTDPIILNPSEKKIFYGIPYVNNVDTTIEEFISQTKVNKITSSNKNKTAYYSYVFPDKYLKDATSNHGRTYSEGQPVENNTLYVLESYDSTNNKGTRKKELENTNLNFIPNDGYYHGLDCSSSTFLAISRELPFNHPMTNSKRYLTSSQVHLSGDIDVSFNKIEKYIRDNGKIDENTEMSESLIDTYYKEFFNSEFESASAKQVLYNGYGLLVPGDTLVIRGHVRMESGYPHVTCKDGTSPTIYTKNFCVDHGGISPTKSYVIITETGQVHQNKSQTDEVSTYVEQSATGWEYSLNPKLTDITSLDDLYDSEKGLLSIFKVNKKYTFGQLFGSAYLPYKYKNVDKLTNENKIEIPTAKVYLDKEYDNISQEIYNQLDETKRLKGTIATNYIIENIKFEIGDEVYYTYPIQTNQYSLYYDLTNQEILDKLSSLDYTKLNSIKVSVKTASKISQMKNFDYIDDSGYITVIDTTGLSSGSQVKTTDVVLEDEEITLNVGDTRLLNATVFPSDAANKELIWDSDSKKIVSVTSDGEIRALKSGRAIITATTKDTGISAQVIVNVVVPVEGIEIQEKEINIDEGDTKIIQTTITPSDATNKEVMWSSSNSSVVTVTSDGEIIAISPGTATVTVTTDDGGKTATATVNVIKPIVSVESITINKESTDIYVGDNEQLYATISPANATNQNVNWSSSNTNIVTVSSSGLIVGIREGNATITATSEDGNKSAVINVNVNTKNVPVDNIYLSKTNTNLYVGGSEQLHAILDPVDATNQNVSWISSNTGVVTVSQTGLIEGIKKGSATVTVTSEDGNKSAAINVSVLERTISVEGIALNKTYTQIDEGDNEQLYATIIPENATNQNVRWSCSNTSIVTVSSSGLIIGVSEGEAQVSATSIDNNKTATITVNVKKKIISVQNVSLNKTNLNIEKGNKELLQATIEPLNATNKELIWSSSDDTIAMVTSDGLVSAVGSGRATITVRTKDGGKTATATVIVTEPFIPVSELIIQDNNITLDKGEQYTINVTISPENATNKVITWESNNTEVVSVDENGLIYAVSPGEAIITAKADNGNKTATINITVNEEEEPYIPEDPVDPEEPEEPDNPPVDEEYLREQITSKLNVKNDRYFLLNNGQTKGMIDELTDSNLEITRDGVELVSTDVLRTNDVVTIYGKEYIISIKADVYPNGRIDISDFVSLYEYFKNSNSDITEAQKLAADVHENGRIDISDFVSMYSIFKGEN